MSQQSVDNSNDIHQLITAESSIRQLRSALYSAIGELDQTQSTINGDLLNTYASDSANPTSILKRLQTASNDLAQLKQEASELQKEKEWVAKELGAGLEQNRALLTQLNSAAGGIHDEVFHVFLMSRLG